MGQYLIDNNVISSYFSGAFSADQMLRLDAVFDTIPILSVVTEIEARSWLSKGNSKETVIEEFVKDARVLGLSQSVVDECVRLRRTHKIRTPDAIIAATAIVPDLTVLTSDKGFSKITQLKTEDPSHW